MHHVKYGLKKQGGVLKAMMNNLLCVKPFNMRYNRALNMGLKYPTCHNCEYVKESKKQGCKYPFENGVKISRCVGFKYRTSLVKEAMNYVIANYKTFR
jgi:hypothetical protein